MADENSDSYWSETACEFLSELSVPQANPTQPVTGGQHRSPGQQRPTESDTDKAERKLALALALLVVGPRWRVPGG